MKQFFCGVIERDRKLLLIKRGNKLGYGLWAFPGGKAGENEAPERATEREVLEETGVKCRAGKQIFEFYHSPKERVFWFICDFVRGKLKPASDVLDAEWIDKNEASHFNLREGHDQALKTYLDL